jgi:hypothetical protein
MRPIIIGIESKDYLRSKTYANGRLPSGSFGGFDLYGKQWGLLEPVK